MTDSKTQANFLQIHTLTNYASALLNRDDSGLAKRLPYGGISRTRISSQCLKRHWRIVRDDTFGLYGIEGVNDDYRSRELVTKRVIAPLNDLGLDDEVIKAIDAEFQKAVYGDKGTTRKGRQTLLLGEPEIQFLASEALKIANEHGSDIASVKEAVKEWTKTYRANIKAMREQTMLPGGLASALFGRMITADVEANIDAPIHVAHAFTVHEQEHENDYFTAVDDLQGTGDEAGTDHLSDTELTSGLFYSYVVVDRQMLIDNLGGDHELAGEIIRRLVHLIATVSPGAKLGSTAPYSWASFMMAEAGNRQPRSLAEAFRKPCGFAVQDAIGTMRTHLENLDENYGANEIRKFMSVNDGAAMPAAARVNLPQLAQWAGDAIKNGAS